MFALTPGELAMVLFLFALIWGAGLLPRFGEHLGAQLQRRARSAHDAKHVRSAHDATPTRSPRDGG